MKNILILCTGNSCRSQMAEAIINHDFANLVHAQSAGTYPAPQVAPNAIKALELVKIKIDGLLPKTADSLLQHSFDLVITVCDNAKESCPVFPKNVSKVHMPFHDPHGEPLESFIKVRDEIRDQLGKLIKNKFHL